MNGKELQKAIIDLARTRHWRVAHFPKIQDRRGAWRTPVAADGKGFPDLLLVRDRIVVAEIKGDKDRVRSEAQANWIQAFRLSGTAMHIWTPTEWENGVINAILAHRGAPDEGLHERLVRLAADHQRRREEQLSL